MRKIKVVHIITKLELGGAQNNTLYTCSNLNKEIFDVYLLSGSGGILDEDAKKIKNINLIFISSLIREISPLKDLKSIFEIYKILRKIKPDIVHTHSSKAGIIGRIASFFSGTAVIIHSYHGFGFNDTQKWYVKYLYIFIEWIVSFITKFFIFVSNENIKTAKKYHILKGKNYSLIRSGIKLSNFKKEKNRSFLKNIGINNFNKIVATVANLKPQKNPSDFIKVAEVVIKKNPDVYFIYAGGGDNIEYYRETVKKIGIEKNCFFIGWVSEPQTIYNCSDIFILTSLWEGLPRSLVEAIACGIIPICYKTDGVNDIIIDGVNGFLVEQKNYIKMANIIQELINDDALFDKITQNVKKTDLIEFDIDSMVVKQEELYKILL